MVDRFQQVDRHYMEGNVGYAWRIEQTRRVYLMARSLVDIT
jgi:hypothetical protein